MGRREAALIAIGGVLRDYQQATAEGQLMAEERLTPSSRRTVFRARR